MIIINLDIPSYSQEYLMILAYLINNDIKILSVLDTDSNVALAALGVSKEIFNAHISDVAKDMFTLGKNSVGVAGFEEGFSSVEKQVGKYLIK